MTEFDPEYTGSYSIVLQKLSGGIRDTAPVDNWRRSMGYGIVQTTQQTTTKTCIDTYTIFNQLTLSKDGDSHCLFFLDVTYLDPAFSSAKMSRTL